MINDLALDNFKRDVHRLLSSSLFKNRFFILDSRVVDLGFQIPESGRIQYLTTPECVRLLKAYNRKFICLTIGTSYWLPSLGDNEWIPRTSEEFEHPVFRGYRDIFIAELHCECNKSEETGIDVNDYHRISVYAIDGLAQTKVRIYRFERGSEIDEANLLSGQDLDNEVLSVDNFSDPGAYRAALAAEGKGFSSLCCWGISNLMTKYNLTFPQAYRLSESNGNIIRLNNKGVSDA